MSFITDDGDFYKAEADFYYDEWVDAVRKHDALVDAVQIDKQELKEVRLQLQAARNDVHKAMTCAEILFEFIITELDPDPSDMLRDYLGGNMDQIWDDLEERYGHG